MSNYDFDHSLTPSELREINLSLATLFASEDYREHDEAISKLIADRDNLICAYLKTLSPDDANAFAQQEMEVNRTLTALTKDIVNALRTEAVTLNRNRAALKKYR